MVQPCSNGLKAAGFSLAVGFEAISAHGGGLALVALAPPQTGQGLLQLQTGVGAQEDVEEGVQQGVEAGQAVAEAVDEEDGVLELARRLSPQQGHEPVAAHEVVRPEDGDEVDRYDHKDAHDLVSLVIRQGRRAPERHSDVR